MGVWGVVLVVCVCVGVGGVVLCLCVCDLLIILHGEDTRVEGRRIHHLSTRPRHTPGMKPSHALPPCLYTTYQNIHLSYIPLMYTSHYVVCVCVIPVSLLTPPIHTSHSHLPFTPNVHP